MDLSFESVWREQREGRELVIQVGTLHSDFSLCRVASPLPVHFMCKKKGVISLK